MTLFTMILLGGVAVLLGVSIMRERNACRTKIRKFDHRPRMTSEQFLVGITVTEAEKSVILGVRAGVAGATGLMPEALYPYDSFEELLQLGFDGMDFIEILVGIEEAMNVRLRRDLIDEEIEKIAGGSMNFTLIDFAQRCAQQWGVMAQARREKA